MSETEKEGNRVERTNLAVGKDDHLGLARVGLLGSAAIDLAKNVVGSDLRMLGCLGGLLLLLQVCHVTNRVNVGIRLELERLFDFDQPARGERVRTERLDKARCGSGTVSGDLCHRRVWG